MPDYPSNSTPNTSNGDTPRTSTPRDGSDDIFKPPLDPILVRCLHCGQEYLSSLIWFRKNPPSDRIPGFWCCPIEGCDGKGFEFDIYPLDSPIWGDDEGDDSEGDQEDRDLDDVNLNDLIDPSEPETR